MPVIDDRVAELKHAYEILDVAPNASARAIKQAYRKLAKRWHPDRYASGTQAQAEATQMMKAINEAYSCIMHAPLRHKVEQRSGTPAVRHEKGHSGQEISSDFRDFSRTMERYAYWTRFVCGALLGFGLTFQVWKALYRHLPVAAGITIAAMMLCGWATARYRSKFWY